MNKKKSSKKDLLEIAEEMGKIGLKAPSIKKLKQILESRYDQCTPTFDVGRWL